MILRNQRETKYGGVSMASQTETSLSTKRKAISLLGGRKVNRAKKPRRQKEITYAEVLRGSEAKWTPVERRNRYRNRIESLTGMEGYEDRSG